MSDVFPTTSRLAAAVDLECGNEEPFEAVAIRSMIPFNLHTCYYNDFFLLRILITVNGTQAEIKIDPSGRSLIQHSESGLDYPLSNLVPGVATTLSEKHGVYHIDTFYHEEAALFSIVFPSQSCLRKFLENKENVESDLVEVLSTQFKTGPEASQQTLAQANRSLTSERQQDLSRQELQLQVSINAKLFLVSPTRSSEQEKQPPVVHKVTLTTFEHFIDKWQQSKLFDFDSSMFSEDDGLSQHQSPQKGMILPDSEDIELKNLQRELKGVEKWFQLGLELGIPDDELRIIRKDNAPFGVEQCLLEVLIRWGDREKRTWTKVVGALVKIRRFVLAENIANKYGIEVARMSTASAETSILNKDVERKLSCEQHALDTAVQSRDKLIENIETDLSAELIELQGQNSSLADEIDYLKLKLQHKSKESEYLEESQKKMKSSWKETVERMKKKENEQIKQLQEQLRSKTNQLTQIQKQLEQKEKELAEKIAEVEEKSAIVKQMKEAEKFSTQQQEMKLRQIDSIAYITSSERPLDFGVKLQQLEHAKHEVKTKRKEIETLTQIVTSKDEQINELSTVIKEENEANIDKLQDESWSENEKKPLSKLLLRVKLIRLKEQLNDAEHAKWLSQYKQTRAKEVLQKYKSSIPDITKCTVSLPHEKVEKHSVSHLRVCLFDEDGDPCSGSHNIDTKLTLLADDSIVAGTFSKSMKDNSGEYVVSFTPTRAGDCEIQVTVNGSPLPSGPLSVTVYNYNNPYPGNCSATGSGLNVAEKDKDSECQVVLLDNDSDPCWMEDDIETQLPTPGNREGTHQFNLTAELVHNKSKSTLQCNVHKEEKHNYKITYQPSKKGQHQLNILINGRQIQGSPFTVVVIASPKSLTQPVQVIGDLNGPWFLTSNSQTQIIVTESDSNCCSVLSSEGKKIHSFGSKGINDGQFKDPRGITVDNVGNMYVADSANHRIQKFTFDGKFLQSVGTRGRGQLQFIYPLGVTFNPNDQKLYVCDQRNHHIQVLNLDLTFHSTIGREGTGNGEFQFTKDIAFNSKGDIYVTDCDNHRVQIFNQDGKFLKSLSSKQPGKTLQRPYGIAVDSSDTVYVSERYRDCICVFTAEGEYLTSFGGEGKADGQFDWPFGLHIDNNDSLLVCDTGNDRIQVF